MVGEVGNEPVALWLNLDRLRPLANREREAQTNSGAAAERAARSLATIARFIMTLDLCYRRMMACKFSSM